MELQSDQFNDLTPFRKKKKKSEVSKRDKVHRVLFLTLLVMIDLMRKQAPAIRVARKTVSEEEKALDRTAHFFDL